MHRLLVRLGSRAARLRGGGGVAEERGDVLPVGAHHLHQRGEVAQERVDVREERWQLVVEDRRAGRGTRASPRLAALRKPMKKSRSSGASLPRSISVGLSSRAAGRSCWIERVGVDREALQPVQGQALLVEEGRQRDERLLEALVARRGGREDLLRVRDQPRGAGPRRSLSAVEHLAGVADEPAGGDPLAVEDPQRRGRGRRRTGRGCRSRPRGRRRGGAARPRRPAATPGRPARVGSSKVRKISSSCTASETCAAGSDAALRAAGSRAAGWRPRTRGQLDVGLAEQRLLAQDRARVVAGSARSARRSRSPRRRAPRR